MKQENYFFEDDSPSFPLEYSGEMQLWANVLKQGVYDARSDIRDKRVMSEPIRWMKSNRVYPGSFAWLCELFNLDVEFARSAVTRSR